MQKLETYIGIEPFTVPVDDSAELQALAAQARQLRTMSFAEKLEATKRLVHAAFPVNAYEKAVTSGDTFSRDLVFSKHPLSDALKAQQACCRYQGALFFVLGYESQLGNRHFLQAGPVKPGLSTVFNEIKGDDGKSKIISIFTESLQDKTHDYARANPFVYEQAYQLLPGYTMYSYHRTPSGTVLVANPSEHIRQIE